MPGVRHGLPAPRRTCCDTLAAASRSQPRHGLPRGSSPLPATGAAPSRHAESLKRRARRAAGGAPSALWDPQAESDVLEALLRVKDAGALDHALHALAQACGYTDLLGVDRRSWQYGRHAEHAAELGADVCLPRLLDAAWQIQQHLLPDPQGEHARRVRTDVRTRHREASRTAP